MGHRHGGDRLPGDRRLRARPAGASTSTSTPAATCRRTPSGCTASRRAFLRGKPQVRASRGGRRLPGLRRRRPADRPQRRLRPRLRQPRARRQSAAPRLHESRWIDTLALARVRFPGMHNSLDALCKRFKISLSEREKHGALIDAKLLAAVYLELKGGRERRLELTHRGHGQRASVAADPRRLWRAPAPAGPPLDRRRARRSTPPSSATS